MVLSQSFELNKNDVNVFYIMCESYQTFSIEGEAIWKCTVL